MCLTVELFVYGGNYIFGKLIKKIEYHYNKYKSN